MKKNILANLVGRTWSILSNFLFIPLYIKFLGVESYSIISFTLVLNGLLAVMDAGLTATLSREFSSSQNDSFQKIKIYKTLESTYFILAAFATLFLLFGSDYISHNWLNLNEINPEYVKIYIKIIGFEVGLRLLSNFYTGGLIGLDKQVKSNIYLTIYGIVRNGLVLIPIYYSPSLLLFFIWQFVASLFFVIIVRFDLGKILTGSKHIFFSKLIFDKIILKKIWNFAGGMMLISLVAGLNTQMDKLALSKLLPIETLGLYTLAFALANGLNVIGSPISVAILPKMTNLFTSNKKEEAIEIFNISHLFISSLIFSISAALIFYSQELIWIWTNDDNISLKVSSYLPWITIGMTFLALQLLPFNVAIANGYTKFNNYIGIFSLIFTMPGYWIAVKFYGGIGAAITFSIIQLFSGVIFLYLINKKFLKLSLFKIVFKYYLVPICVSYLIIYTSYGLFIVNDSRLFLLIKIVIIVSLSFIVNSLILFPRSYVSKLLSRINLRFLN